jgi:hypothetical protein
MCKKITIWVTAFVFVSLCVNTIAETLPKSGKIQLQSINRGTSINKYNDEYTHGTVTGVTFNSAGKGLLHMSKSNCSYSVFTHKTINRITGFCAHEDDEGDKLFIQYSGNSNSEGKWEGMDEILGGTGKFEGAKGSGPYSCANTHKESEFPCTTKLKYQLR